jgi:hypothetical protein
VTPVRLHALVNLLLFDMRLLSLVLPQLAVLK